MMSDTRAARAAAATRRLIFPSLAVVLLVSGCRGAATPAAPATERQARLAPGEAFDPSNSSLHIVFASVSNDSRCPSSVTCVWAGNAEVRIVVSGRDGVFPATTYTLNAMLAPRETVVLGTRIRLEQLDPAPVAGSPISPSAYRATLSVVWLPD